MYDLTITGGTCVDGTGGTPFRADLGIKDGVIVEVRRREGDDRVEQDPDELVQSLRTALDDVSEGHDPAQILAAGLATQRSTKF